MPPGRFHSMTRERPKRGAGFRRKSKAASRRRSIRVRPLFTKSSAGGKGAAETGELTVCMKGGILQLSSNRPGQSTGVGVGRVAQ